MSNVLASKIISFATGYKNAFNEKVVSIETKGSIVSIRFLINANRAHYQMDMVNVFANTTLNLNTMKVTIKTENGNGSRKYNSNVKNSCESLVKIFVEEAQKMVDIEIREANSKAYDKCHIELLSLIDASNSTHKNICFGYINQIQDLYLSGASAEEILAKLIAVKKEMLADTRLFPNTTANESNEFVTSETITNKNTYTAYNRSFPSYESAYNYCIESDFDPSYIQSEEPKTASQHSLQLDLQLFSSPVIETGKPFKQPYATYENGVSRFGIGKHLDLIYILETTGPNPNYDSINFSNVNKYEFNDIQSLFDRFNLYQSNGYHNMQFWVEVRYKGETIIENGTEHMIEFMINDSRLRAAKETERENKRLKTELASYKDFISKYKVESTFEKYIKESQNDNKDSNGLYWYEMLFRPLAPFCQPKNHIEYDDTKGRNGIIAYNRPLTENELSEYELRKWSLAN